LSRRESDGGRYLEAHARLGDLLVLVLGAGTGGNPFGRLATNRTGADLERRAKKPTLRRCRLDRLKTFSNLQASSGFKRNTLDLTPFPGQTVRIHLEPIENNGSMTGFVVDDFAIIVGIDGSV